MSRTYRRKDQGTPSWVEPNDSTEEWGIRAYQYHGDANWNTGGVSKNTQWQTNYTRRNDDRFQINNIYNMTRDEIEDYDYIDYTKLYRGFRWNWD